MSDFNDSDNFTVHLLKKQETLLFDVIRRHLELDAKCAIYENAINNYTKENSELKSAFESNKILLDEALKSLELLTVESNNLKNKMVDYNQLVEQKDKLLTESQIKNTEITKLNNDLNTLKQNYSLVMEENNKLNEKISSISKENKPLAIIPTKNLIVKDKKKIKPVAGKKVESEWIDGNTV